MATYEENATYARLMIWRTRDGREINIEDMTRNHLENALNACYNDPRLEPYIEPLTKQLKRKNEKYQAATDFLDGKKESFRNTSSSDGSLSMTIPSGELAGKIRSYCKARNITIRKFAAQAFEMYFESIADEQFDEAKAQVEALTAGLTDEQKKLLASQIIGG